MNRTALLATSLLFCCLTAMGSPNPAVEPYDPGRMSFPVTADQAEAAAVSWLGTPGVALSLDGIESLDPVLGPFYVFSTQDDVQHMSVSCQTGEVVSWANSSLMSTYDARRLSSEPGDKLPGDQLREDVRQFLAAKFTDFTTLNMQPVEYNVFVSRLPNGVWDWGNHCSVCIDEYTGSICYCRRVKSEPVSISPTAAVSQANAEAAALGVFSGRPEVNSEFVLSNEGLWVDRDDLGLQRLLWNIVVVTCDAGNYTLPQYLQEAQNVDGFPHGDACHVMIDANTGAVASVGGGMLGNSILPNKLTSVPRLSVIPKPKKVRMPMFTPAVFRVNGVTTSPSLPPLIIDRAPYLYARYLPFLLDCRISFNQGRVAISSTRSWVFDLRKGEWSLDGKCSKLGGQARIICGRVYLPLETLNRVSGGCFRWDSKSRTLDVTAKPSRATAILGRKR